MNFIKHSLWFLLFFSFSIGMPILTYYIIRDFKKPIPEDEHLHPFFQFIKKLGILLVSIIFAMTSIGMTLQYIRDFPNVLSNNPNLFKGTCEVDLNTENERKVPELQVLFNDTALIFSKPHYRYVKEGVYHCEITYFKHTERGDFFKLYEYEGGPEIPIRWDAKME